MDKETYVKRMAELNHIRERLCSLMIKKGKKQ